jgi:hypothetical protein
MEMEAIILSKPRKDLEKGIRKTMRKSYAKNPGATARPDPPAGL